MFTINEGVVKDPNAAKNRSNDRILVLKVKDETRPISSTGLVDTRLFKGENRLHAVLDEETSLWCLKYDQGGIPPYLKQRFTSFTMLMKTVSEYFDRRNVEISEIID